MREEMLNAFFISKHIRFLRPLFERGVRDIVFGVQDGLVSTLGVLVGIAQGTQDHFIVMISGLVIVCVESLSMAAGSFLSSKAHRQYEEHLLSREMREIENNIADEIQEIFDMYRSRGYKEDEIEIIKERLLSDKSLLLEDMAHKELGIIPQKLDNPFINALFMGISYIIGGMIPATPFLFIHDIPGAMMVSFAGTGLALFILGAVKGTLFGIGWIKSGLEIFFVAASASLIGYGVGCLARYFL